MLFLTRFRFHTCGPLLAAAAVLAAVAAAAAEGAPPPPAAAAAGASEGGRRGSRRSQMCCGSGMADEAKNVPARFSTDQQNVAGEGVVTLTPPAPLGPRSWEGSCQPAAAWEYGWGITGKLPVLLPGNRTWEGSCRGVVGGVIGRGPRRGPCKARHSPSAAVVSTSARMQRTLLPTGSPSPMCTTHPTAWKPSGGIGSQIDGSASPSGGSPLLPHQRHLNPSGAARRPQVDATARTSRAGGRVPLVTQSPKREKPSGARGRQKDTPATWRASPPGGERSVPSQRDEVALTIRPALDGARFGGSLDRCSYRGTEKATVQAVRNQIFSQPVLSPSGVVSVDWQVGRRFGPFLLQKNTKRIRPLTKSDQTLPGCTPAAARPEGPEVRQRSANSRQGAARWSARKAERLALRVDAKAAAVAARRSALRSVAEARTALQLTV
eukprot:107348-Prorocentrum_minimum.AAC.1